MKQFLQDALLYRGAACKKIDQGMDYFTVLQSGLNIPEKLLWISNVQVVVLLNVSLLALVDETSRFSLSSVSIYFQNIHYFCVLLFTYSNK